MTMYSPPGPPPQDIVVFPIRGRSLLQLLVALVLGAVFFGIAAAIVYAAITDGQRMFLIALPIMALALIGLFIDQLKNHRRARTIRHSEPVLVVNSYGIGDSHLHIPWSVVRSVHTRAAPSRRSPANRNGLGAILAEKLVAVSGVLDGEFLLVIDTTHPPPPHLAQRGASTVRGHRVVYDLGTAIPSARWKPLERAITQYAAWRGVPVNGSGVPPRS